MPKRRTDIASKRLRKTAKQVAATLPVVPVLSTVNGAPVKPASLSGRAGEIWGQFAPDLTASGMLTHRDVLTFGLWCQLAAKVEDGQLSGALITQFRLLANDFGLTPSGKGRELGAPGPPAKPNKFFKD
jgi:phage terminase small subunit